MRGKKQETRESSSKKKETRGAKQFPKSEFFSPREERILKGKRSRENLLLFLIVCVKEKLHAKRDNKSCVRVKLLLHSTTVTTLLNCSLRSF